MRPTTEGLSASNFYMTCMSFDKGNQKGLEVVQGAYKESIFDENMIINAEHSSLREDNKLQTAKGEIINFKKDAFEIVKINEKNRKTKYREDRERA